MWVHRSLCSIETNTAGSYTKRPGSGALGSAPEVHGLHIAKRDSKMHLQDKVLCSCNILPGVRKMLTS